MIEDVPIISINVRIWKFWSFIIVHNWKRYISVIPVCMLNVFQFMDLQHAWGNFDILIINAYFTVLYFNAVVRTILLIKNRDKFEGFMGKLEIMYNEIQSSNEEDMKKILIDHTKKARFLTKYNLFLGAFISTCFITYPMFTNGRAHPYGVYIFGIEKYKSPLYEIIYVLQALLTIPGCCMYIPFSNLFVSYVLFGIVTAQILQKKLRNICDINKSEEQISKEIKACIIYHKRIIGYVSQMNSLVTYICLLEFLSFGTMLCALLFLLNLIDVIAQLIIVGCYIFMILYQIFTFYFFANELLVESLKISQEAYNSSWYNHKTPIKMYLILIIMRAQKPLQIMVGNLYPMTMEMFQSLLNASYTYFTILRRVYN